ncbi:rho GTPase-activating protein 19 [Chrysoperla carnea]|uniref:rho GTPase-activating protein 19 n=1 Tax=Chrysoperla carnea TaxID=189513 RepID=UPI001D097624|nr:rho GTPase-activating protein 19 [Chrysoperla carnea]
MSFDNSYSDIKLAEKIKRENPEQFHTLVRMHLSFVLDLQTDDNECISEKAKFKKWGLFPKKSKCRGVMEGAPLTQEGICQVYQLIEFLSKEPNINQEGIFRRTGSLNRQQELRALLNTGQTLDLDSGPYSVHDCASVLKGFLAELPEPLLTDAHYTAHCQIAELCGGIGNNTTVTNEPRLLRSLQLLLLLLPVENRVLLKDVLELLNLVASYESQNKMSADSLATLFTPHLLCPRKLSPEALHTNSQTMSRIVSFMIKKSHKLFDIPPKLATDIRAYYLEREKKKILSPLKDLNESVSDSTAANTVYTFVDRERTAQEHVTNPTEAALAQLYAHIQSLPESSKKRKLIKQFNKENGQGTPLQIQRSQKKDLRGKSLGDSIKKHIFQKTLAKNVKKSSLLLTPASTALCHQHNEILNTPENLNIFSTPQQITTISRLFLEQNETESTTPQPKKCLDETSVEQLINYSDNDLILNKSKTEETVKNLRFSDEIQILNSSSSLQANTEDDDINARGITTPVSKIEQKNSWNTSNYLTSTPAGTWLTKTAGGGGDELFTPHVIGRKSMSPITRSARRMSKAMQESMMTPRSRKPVLLISGTNICQLASVRTPIHTSIIENEDTSEEIVAVQQQNDNPIENEPLKTDESEIIQTESTEDIVTSDEMIDDTSFQEMSKDELSSFCDNSHTSRDPLKNDKEETSLINITSDKTTNCTSESRNNTSSCLSSTFRDYLLTRSILTASPADLSFSSREGDFDSSSSSSSDVENEEVLNDSENKLSDSLLYCLDGNNPNNDSSSSLKRRLDEDENNEVESAAVFRAEKHLTLKLRKLSQTGDVVYETSL